MKEWKITGPGLKDLIIKAKSFDEALELARKIDPDYVGGQLIKGGN